MDLLNACKLAYQKHHLNDDSVGWNELDEALRDALCEALGDEEFLSWANSISGPPRSCPHSC